jgi:peptidoglycan/xylan/chitin deacetylase (PgdA/CDA1 family)
MRNYVKRLTKLLISLIFLFYRRLANRIMAILGLKVEPECTILYYHAVSASEQQRFAWQMDKLLCLTTPIAADSQQDLKPGINYSAITFDDGVESALENAVPELVQRKIPATIFVVANFIGTRPEWAIHGPEYDEQEKISTLEQLHDLPCDLITIGSHTLSHPWLPSISESEAKAELLGSRKKLETLLNREIKLFSFPYGAMSNDLVKWCREAGYERVFTVVPAYTLSDPHEFVCGRVTADPSDWHLEFRLKLLGGYQWMRYVHYVKRKLFPLSYLK